MASFCTVEILWTEHYPSFCTESWVLPEFSFFGRFVQNVQKRNRSWQQLCFIPPDPFPILPHPTLFSKSYIPISVMCLSSFPSNTSILIASTIPRQSSTLSSLTNEVLNSLFNFSVPLLYSWPLVKLFTVRGNILPTATVLCVYHNI